MSDLQSIHGHASRNMMELLAGIGDDQWNNPTPCSEWNVRDLVNHITAENLWVPELIAGKTIAEVGSLFDGDVLGDNPKNAAEKSCEVADGAMHQPGALEVTCHLSYGDFPGAYYMGHRIIDLVIHGWDLAVGTNQDTTIDPELVSAVEKIIEPEVKELQGSGFFGRPQDVDDNAGSQTHLLAALGRNG